MKTKPKPKEYYDIHDLLYYFNLKNIDDLINSDDIRGNDSLVSLYWDEELEEYVSKSDKKSIKRISNIRKVVREFGEIEVKVWW